MLRDYMEYQLRRQVTTNGLTLMDESVGSEQDDTLVVHAVNDGY